MQTTTHEKLRSLLASARIELQTEADEYDGLLNQLELLQGSLDANEISEERLSAVMRAFPAKLRPMRAGAPAGEGLKETRKLWEQLNHIIQSRQPRKT
jgi:hypothetical protein